MNIWQSYKQEGGCFVHFLRFIAVSNIHRLIFFTDRLNDTRFLSWLVTAHHTLNMQVHYLVFYR